MDYHRFFTKNIAQRSPLCQDFDKGDLILYSYLLKGISKKWEFQTT